MSILTRIYGIRITTNTVLNNSDIGLTSGVLRWSESALTGVSGTWNTGIISSITPIKKYADFTFGGNVPVTDGLSIAIQNTEQLTLRLVELEIFLHNLPIELIEFVGTTFDSDSEQAGGYVRFTGVVESVQWAETGATINVKNRQKVQSASIQFSKENADGGQVEFPVTFGKFSDIPTEVVRDGVVKIYKKCSDIFGTPPGTRTPSDAYKFPVVSTSTGSRQIVDYYLQSCATYTGTAPTNTEWSHTNLYCEVVDGKGKGEVRKVDQTSGYGFGDNKVVHMSVSTVFSEPLSADIADQSWVSFFTTAGNDYYVDGWDISNLLSFSGGIADTPDIYAKGNSSTIVGKAGSTGEVTGKTSSGVEQLLACPSGTFLAGAQNYIVTSQVKDKYLTGSMDDIFDLRAYPVVTPALMGVADLARYGYPDHVKRFDGLYGDAGGLNVAISTINSINGITSTTYVPVATDCYSVHAKCACSNTKVGISFFLPPQAAELDYDNAYLLVDIESENTALGLECFIDRDMGYGVKQFKIDPRSGSVSSGLIRNVQEGYYTNGVGMVANDFYHIAKIEGEFLSVLPGQSLPHWLNSGYTILPLPSVKNNSVDSGTKLSLFIDGDLTQSELDLMLGAIRPKIHIRTIAVAFTAKYAVKEKIYTHLWGRVIGGAYPGNVWQEGVVPWASGPSPKIVEEATNTPPSVPVSGKYIWIYTAPTGVWAGKADYVTSWNGTTWVYYQPQSGNILFDLSHSSTQRMYNGSSWEIVRMGGRTLTTDDLLDNPIKVLEHVSRLQDYSLLGATTTPGKEYYAGAPIKLSGTGSFDDSGLATVEAIECARQITEEAQADILEIKRSLCKQFSLCSYQDESGYDCVLPITTAGTPTIEITLFDIIPGSIGNMVEPEASNVYCRPVFNYAWNPATQKYDKSLKVTNVEKATWIADYTPGWTAGDGETAWIACKALWSRYFGSTTMPPDLSDLTWCNTYTSAAWVANNLISWMGKRRISFSVLYTVGLDWIPGTKIKLKLPHQTNGGFVNCIVEQITIDKTSGTCQAAVILLGDITTNFF